MSEYEKQALKFLKDTETTFKAEYQRHDLYFEDDKEERDIYKITLTRGNRSFDFNFGQSIANTGTEPTSYDVLACLTKYDVGTLEDFCSEFGYDEDSRKAEKIYKAVLKEWAMVQTLWNEAEVEKLQEIQ